MAKTDWTGSDTVKPADMNEIGQEINQLREDVDNIHIPPATLTEAGITQLSSATDSASETMAATPKAVKAAYDRADAAFTSASDGKGKVRDAITGVKGTVADADGDGVPTFDELAAGVKTIPAGYTADATAAAGDIRSGKSAYKNGVKVNGSLVTQATGAQTVMPGPSDIVKGAGIYDGAITIKGVPVPADKVLTGTTIAGTAGTMPNQGSLVLTPSPTSNVSIPSGYHSGLGYITPASRSASGIINNLTMNNPNSNYNFALTTQPLVSGLAFRPGKILVRLSYTATSGYTEFLAGVFYDFCWNVFSGVNGGFNTGSVDAAPAASLVIDMLAQGQFRIASLTYKSRNSANAGVNAPCKIEWFAFE